MRMLARRLLALGVAGSLLLTPQIGLADPPTAPEIVPLELGQAAPFDGQLVPESTFLAYMRQTVAVQELELRLQAALRVAQDYADRVATAESTAARAEGRSEACPDGPAFFERHGLVIGFVLGVVGAGLVVWAAVSVLDAQNP